MDRPSSLRYWLSVLSPVGLPAGFAWLGYVADRLDYLLGVDTGLYVVLLFPTAAVVAAVITARTAWADEGARRWTAALAALLDALLALIVIVVMASGPPVQ